MSISFDQVSNEELFLMLDCDDLKEIERKINKEKLKIIITQGHYQTNYPRNKMLQVLTTTLTDAPSYSLLLLWSVIGLLSLTILPLSIITAGFGSIMLIASGIYFLSNFRELNKLLKKVNDFFKLASIQLAASEELIKRQYAQISFKNDELQERVTMRNNFVLKPETKFSNRLPKIKESVGTTLMLGSTLFGTYYLGITAIIEAFGLSMIVGAMAGPIGIAIALSASFAIAAYFGYKHYQVCKHNALVKKQEKKLGQEIKERFYLCHELKTLLDQQKSLSGEKKSNSSNYATIKRYQFKKKYYSHFQNPMILLKRRRLGPNPKPKKYHYQHSPTKMFR